MKRIPLTQGRFAIVDDEDYPYLNRFRWYLRRLPDGEEYAGTGIYLGKRTVQIPLYYFLIERKLGFITLFKNKDSLDNRKENLIMVSASVAGHQTRKYKMREDNRTGMRSKFKGLAWHPQSKKWQVSIIKDKKRTYIGLFENEEDGARAYNSKARELYGEYAYQNIID